jgi:hypothetical protein
MPPVSIQLLKERGDQVAIFNKEDPDLKRAKSGKLKIDSDAREVFGPGKMRQQDETYGNGTQFILLGTWKPGMLCTKQI